MKKFFLLSLFPLSIAFSQELNLYGTAHMAFDAISYSETMPNRDKFSTVLTSHYSTLGLKHTTDFSSDLKGYAAVETRITGNQGEYQTDQLYYVGLYSQLYGTLQFGKQDSPAFKLLMEIDPLFSRIGDYKSITKGFSNINGYLHDQPYKDTIAYFSPTWNHFRFDFSIVTDQDSKISSGDYTGNTNEPHALGLTYRTKDTTLGATLTNIIKNGVTKAETSIRLGGKQVWSDFTFSALYDYSKDAEAEIHHALMFSTQFKYDKTKYTAQLNYGSNLNGKRKKGATVQLAADYSLNKTSLVYFQFSEAIIEDTANIENGQLNYNKDFAFSLGIIYNFSQKIN